MKSGEGLAEPVELLTGLIGTLAGFADSEIHKSSALWDLGFSIYYLNFGEICTLLLSLVIRDSSP